MKVGSLKLQKLTKNIFTSNLWSVLKEAITKRDLITGTLLLMLQ